MKDLTPKRFRLPLLISLFRFRGLEAVILNKATSLIVVATALPFRAATVPFADVWAHWPIIANLLLYLESIIASVKWEISNSP